MGNLMLTLNIALFLGNTGNNFAVNSASGVISSAASASIDYELIQNFTLVVAASDGTSSANTTVQVIFETLFCY